MAGIIKGFVIELLNNIPLLYEEVIGICAIIGAIYGGINYVNDIKKYNNDSYIDIIFYCFVGTLLGIIVGLLSPISIPILLISGIIYLIGYKNSVIIEKKKE